MGRLRDPVHHSEDYLLAIGKRQPVTKSIAMCDQGREGTGSGWSSPAGVDWSPYPQHKWDRPTRTVERPSPWTATKTAA